MINITERTNCMYVKNMLFSEASFSVDEETGR